MLDTFITSFRLKNTYRTNTIIYSIRCLPIIGKLLPASLYGSGGLTTFANVLSVSVSYTHLDVYKRQLQYRSFLADTLAAVLCLAGASHTCSEATSHSLFKTELSAHLSGNGFIYSPQHPFRSTSADVSAIDVSQGVRHKSLSAHTAICCGHHHVGPQFFEFIYIKAFVFTVESQYHHRPFSPGQQLPAQPVHRLSLIHI